MTKSRSAAAGSEFSRFKIAGAIWLRKAWTAKTAARLPAAPSRWPVAALVAVIAGPLRAHPAESKHGQHYRRRTGKNMNWRIDITATKTPCIAYAEHVT